jgi:hypothetical protein
LCAATNFPPLSHPVLVMSAGLCKWTAVGILVASLHQVANGTGCLKEPQLHPR